MLGLSNQGCKPRRPRFGKRLTGLGGGLTSGLLVGLLVGLGGGLVFGLPLGLVSEPDYGPPKKLLEDLLTQRRLFCKF